MNPEPVPVPNSVEMPSKQYFLQEYPINIKFLSRGVVIEVGCKSIAFENVDDAMKALNDYVNQPYESQNYWRKIL